MIAQILDLGPKEYKRIVPALFAYYFHRIDLRQFIRHVGDQAEGNRIKEIARKNGYILKNCKLYAYACYANRVSSQRLPRPVDFGVAAEDAVILRRLNLSHLDTKAFKAFTLQEFDDTLNAMIASAEIKNNIGKFVSKKMAFLMKSYDEKREDIEAMLKGDAVEAIYKTYPRFMSYLHMVNVAKAQIHNKGQTFITSSTAKSRQRLQRTADGGFEAVHVDLATAADIPAPVHYATELREKMTALAQIEDVLPQRTREFLTCAAGVYHEGFSAYLEMSNEDAAGTMNYQRYMAKCQAYFGTSQEKVDKLYANIRTRIYRTAA